MKTVKKIYSTIKGEKGIAGSFVDKKSAIQKIKNGIGK